MKKLIQLLCISLFVITAKAQTIELETLSNQSYQDLQGATVVSPSYAWSYIDYFVPNIGIVIKSPGGANLISLSISDSQIDLVNNNYGDLSLVPLGNYKILDQNYNENLSLQENEKKTSLSSVSYKIDGLAGNKILKVEYKNVKLSGMDNSNFLNFQIWVYEKTGLLEYRYGKTKVPNSYNQVKVSLFEENAIQQLYAYFLEGDSEKPSIAKDTKEHYIDMIPNEGILYRFKSGKMSVNELDVNTVSVFPTPSNGSVNIKVDDELEINSVIIYDQICKEIKKITELNSIIDNQEIKVSDKVGTYLMLINTNRGETVKKVVIVE